MSLLLGTLYPSQPIHHDGAGVHVLETLSDDIRGRGLNWSNVYQRTKGRSNKKTIGGNGPFPTKNIDADQQLGCPLGRDKQCPAQAH